MNDQTFKQWGGLAVIIVGVCSLLYGLLYVALIVLPGAKPPTEALTSFGTQCTNLLLAASGIFGIVASVAIFERLRLVNEGWARAALWLGVIGAVLGGLHGWYDFVRNPILAQLYADPATASVSTVVGSLPSSIDPRGLGTFGLTGLSILIISQLIYQAESLPKRLGAVAQISSALLGLIFLGTVLWADGTGPAFARYLFLIPGPLQAIVVGPLYYIWFGSLLRRN
ncbi:MAG: DUF4386 family protein [Anaerolineae bacterium]|nr:DUF4386 family protein [Anaerolineae bacterium]